jgi:hypothetical protein
MASPEKRKTLLSGRAATPADIIARAPWANEGDVVLTAR